MALSLHASLIIGVCTRIHPVDIRHRHNPAAWGGLICSLQRQGLLWLVFVRADFQAPVLSCLSSRARMADLACDPEHIPPSCLLLNSLGPMLTFSPEVLALLDIKGLEVCTCVMHD